MLRLCRRCYNKKKPTDYLKLFQRRMNTYELILKKRNKQSLTQREIEFLVSGYTGGKIPDYQFSAFLMVAFLNGMDEKETFYLTKAMLESGQAIDLSFVKEKKIDKHSSGGVGDKVSLILAPLVASCGVTVPMVSGRALGHTGGTLDKLESIPGFRTNLSIEEFKTNLSEIGVGIMGQTEEIAPADGKIYALRDVTATVDYVPFITASILSKKLALKSDAVLFDIKSGNGAFMRTGKEAIGLAKSLIKIGSRFKRKMVALITDMNEPLGEAVGNSLEVIETIQSLKGNVPPDLKEVTYALSSSMLILAGRVKSFNEGIKLSEQQIRNGKALEKFKQMLQNQGGDTRIVEDYTLLPEAKFRLEVKALKTGYVQSINTFEIGMVALELGAGRKTKETKIDYGVGLLIKKKVGDLVKKGETLAIVLANDREKGKEAVKTLLNSYQISPQKRKNLQKILYYLDSKTLRKWSY